MAAGQLFAGDAERTVRLGAATEDHRMVQAREFFDRQVPADGDVADEVEARRFRDPPQSTR